MRPKAPVRRYDLFAAWRFLDALEEGKSVPKAKQYGVWIATVVAARKFRRPGRAAEGKTKPKRQDFLGLAAGDYDERIRARMGATFHDRVFLPALRRLRRAGKSYVEIRDTVRRAWKP